MDFSDDDDLFPERDIGELNEMGWTYRTFGDTNRYYTTQMLRLLFDDFHIQVRCIDLGEEERERRARKKALLSAPLKSAHLD